MAGGGSSVDPVQDAQQILFFSIVGGLSPLIPVPLLDSVFKKVVRRLMIMAQLKFGGLNPTIQQVNSLAREAPMSPLQLLLKALYYVFCCCLLEFVLKKICFMFTIKDCVENTSELLHDGWLLAYAVKSKKVNENLLADKTAVWRVAEATIQTCDEVDTSPLHQAVKKVLGANKGDLQTAANMVLSSLRGQGIGGGFGRRPSQESVQDALDNVEQEQRQELSGLTRKLADVLRDHQPYLRNLETVFDQKLNDLQSKNVMPPQCPLLAM